MYIQLHRITQTENTNEKIQAHLHYKKNKRIKMKQITKTSRKSMIILIIDVIQIH